MGRPYSPQEAPFPSIKLPKSDWYITSIGTILGVIGLYFAKRPGWTITIAILALPMLLWIAIYLLRLLPVAIGRVANYDKLYSYSVSRSEQATQALGVERQRITERETQIQELTNRLGQVEGEGIRQTEALETLYELLLLSWDILMRLEVRITGITLRNGEPHLIIDEGTRKPVRGDRIVVIDKEGRALHGQFEVSEWSGGQYLARAVRDIDPMWWAVVRDKARLSSAPPERCTAIVLPREEEDSNAGR